MSLREGRSLVVHNRLFAVNIWFLFLCFGRFRSGVYGWTDGLVALIMFGIYC
jgi:hypothetical protein